MENCAFSHYSTSYAVNKRTRNYRSTMFKAMRELGYTSRCAGYQKWHPWPPPGRFSEADCGTSIPKAAHLFVKCAPLYSWLAAAAPSPLGAAAACVPRVPWPSAPSSGQLTDAASYRCAMPARRFK